MDTLNTMPIATSVLVILWAWGRMEKTLDKRNLSSYRPLPIPFECTYTSSQVSVIVCTIDTLLARSLRTWLANKPFEILIVTIPEHRDKINSVVTNASLSAVDFAKVTVLVSATKGKRAQLDMGIRHAKGSILTTVDDHIYWDPDFLNAMLPCFEDETVGAVGPTTKPIIPKERQSRDIITPWEVAAMRVAWNRNPQLKASYAAGRWCWILAGVTGVYRAYILKDPLFLEGYANDSWRGKKLGMPDVLEAKSPKSIFQE